MMRIRQIRFGLIGVLALGLASPMPAADLSFPPAPDVHFVALNSGPQIDIPAPRARMAPELALQVYQNRLLLQSVHLGEYQDDTTIEAELPQARKKGLFHVQRMFSAPKSLAFKAVDFVGDGFVKTNVIARLLQSEVDHVQKGEDSSTAITAKNYKFSYKGTDQIADAPVHVFLAKPRRKAPGLFKGRIYLNVYTGEIVRAEGKMVKSPSFFVKNIEFIQEYARVGEFNLISHIHSTADTRIVGKAIVDIRHNRYQAKSLPQASSSSTGQTVSFTGN